MELTFNYQWRWCNRSGRIDPDKLPDFFALIGFLTGMDRPAAEALLRSGTPIRHNQWTFYCHVTRPYKGTSQRTADMVQ